MVYDAILTKSLLKNNMKNGQDGIQMGNDNQSLNKLNNGGLVLMLVSTLFIVVPVSVILLDIGNEKINVFSHLGGFILGLLVSITVALICESNQKRARAFFIFFLALILLVPAISWTFF